MIRAVRLQSNRLVVLEVLLLNNLESFRKKPGNDEDGSCVKVIIKGESQKTRKAVLPE